MNAGVFDAPSRVRGTRMFASGKYIAAPPRAIWNGRASTRSEPVSLVNQVASRLTKLENKRWRFSSMVLVSNGRVEPEWTAARAVLARGLLSRLKKSAGCRLVLSVDPRTGRRACYTLDALAAAMDEEAIGSGVSVSVRHGLGDPLYWPSCPEAQIAHAS